MRVLIILPVLASFVIGGASAAYSDQNTIFLIQETPAGNAAGNTLFVDQSAASGATVAGTPNGLSPARQTGSSNLGQITAAGQDLTVVFAQGQTNAFANDNAAQIGLDGGNLLASLQQLGDGNSATLDIRGNDNTGLITQTGNGNDGTLAVNGNGANGALIQTGDGNRTDLTVTGASVTFEVVGDNLTFVGTNPSVTSNGGTVTIRQSLTGGN